MGTFWHDNYAFIKDVYDTRSGKLVELMEKTDASIRDVCDEKKLYTSAEFKKVKETFTVGKFNVQNLELRWGHKSRLEINGTQFLNEILALISAQNVD